MTHKNSHRLLFLFSRWLTGFVLKSRTTSTLWGTLRRTPSWRMSGQRRASSKMPGIQKRWGDSWRGQILYYHQRGNLLYSRQKTHKHQAVNSQQIYKIATLCKITIKKIFKRSTAAGTKQFLSLFVLHIQFLKPDGSNWMSFDKRKLRSARINWAFFNILNLCLVTPANLLHTVTVHWSL